MRAKSIAFLAIALLAIANPANADPAASTWWSSIGAACTPADSAIQYNLYSNVGGAISVSSASQVVVYCPVHTLKASPDFLNMTSKGKNGGTMPGGTAFIRAQLVSMNRFTATETVLATLSGTSSTSPVTDSVGFVHTFDFSLNYYYVKVTIAGDGLTVDRTKVLYGVSLSRSTM